MLPITSPNACRVEYRQLALDLMARHGLRHWNFAYNRRKRAMGVCYYTAKTIELSVHFVDHNGLEEIRDTILHEIAHALVGAGHGHNATWKKKCVEIGARPLRCGQAAMPLGRWRAHCGACGVLFSRHRRPKRLKGWFCQACGPERGSFTWQTDG